MNAADLPRGELIAGLRTWAEGDTLAMAAVELLILHGHWLHRAPFLAAVTVTPNRAVPSFAAVDWDQLGIRLDTGHELHDTASERGVLAIACSLGGGRPVDLGDALLSCDQINVRLIADAVLLAGGAR